MSAPGVAILFALGARLHKSAAEIERLSLRELVAWSEFFWPRAPAANDEPGEDTLDPRTRSREELRSAFAHGR
jgi:hypothetical protein